MPLNPLEVWKSVSKDDIKVGDYARVTEKFADASITYEGEVTSLANDLIYFGKEKRTCAWNESGRYADVVVTIQRREPPFKFPTAIGSAILVHDANYMYERVLVLTQGGVWYSEIGDSQWSQEQIVQSNPRVLFDASRG